MTKTIRTKELTNTRLATNYGGWIYCTNCNKNIGYLCYVTYDNIHFDYECNCGSKGLVCIDFEDSVGGHVNSHDLIVIKNRFCCPEDNAPLITLLSKNLKQYELSITCKSCHQTYQMKASTK